MYMSTFNKFTFKNAESFITEFSEIEKLIRHIEPNPCVCFKTIF